MNRITAAAALLALAASPAVAKNDKPDKPTKAKTVTLKGTVVSSDATSVVVKVTKANKHGRALVGRQVTFSPIERLKVADTNRDGTIDGTDLVADDQVHVQARLAPGAEGPLAARKVVDRTHPAADEDEAETPAPAA